MSRPRTRPPPPGPVRPFDFPHIERDRLDNGFAVLSARHGDIPLVTVALVLETGAAGEPADRTGLARLTAAALETGTDGRSADEIAWAFERLGAELDVDTGWDATIASVTVPRDRLEPAVALLAELVRAPSFPAGEVDRLRDEQLAEILQRTKEPGSLANDVAARSIFAEGVPYARPLVGRADDVRTLGRDGVRRFHRAGFLPNAAALILVGDVDADEAGALAADHFGDWPAGRFRAPEFDVLARVDSTRGWVVDRPGAVQSEVRIGHVGVERHHPDYFPLRVMNTVLGGAFTSRLNMSLRERHGFTYGVRSAFGFRRRPGPFVVQTAVGTDVTARAVGETLRVLRGLHEDGATDEEVSGARDYLRGVLPLQLQTTGQLAGRIADLVIYDLPDGYFDELRERIAAVEAADVARVARAHLRVDRLAVVVVGDAERIAPELRALEFGPVEVREPPA